MVKIVELEVTDWAIYRELRLIALKESPLAFGSTFHEALNKVAEDWRGRLESRNFITLFAKEGNKLIGTVAAMFHTKERNSHVATIIGNYVIKDYRGKGVGSNLMRKIIEKIEERPGIIKINLQVAETQKPAIDLYKKYGFKEVGTQKKELSLDGKFYDVVLMEKILDK